MIWRRIEEMVEKPHHETSVLLFCPQLRVSGPAVVCHWQDDRWLVSFSDACEELNAIPTHYAEISEPICDEPFYSPAEIEILRKDHIRKVDEAMSLARERGTGLHPRVAAIRAQAAAERAQEGNAHGDVPDIAADDQELLRRVVKCTPRRSKRGQPRWAVIMEKFALGSQSAQRLCERFGFDPDEIVAPRG